MCQLRKIHVFWNGNECFLIVQSGIRSMNQQGNISCSPLTSQISLVTLVTSLVRSWQPTNRWIPRNFEHTIPHSEMQYASKKQPFKDFIWVQKYKLYYWGQASIPPKQAIWYLVTNSHPAKMLVGQMVAQFPC